MALPENLRVLRLSRVPRLSQGKLAMLIGLCRTTYADYEIGKRDMPAWVLSNLAHYYKLSTDDLLHCDLTKKGVEKRRRRG